jgi:outer membrane protein assembly factor BamD (BamD/ComL family)
MKNQYFVIVGLVFLMSGALADNFFDTYGQEDLLGRVMSIDVEDDPARLRDAAESFMTRFPNDENIDEVRIKLLSSYVGSKRYITARVYADRLLSNPLLKEAYREDVEYHKVMIGVNSSKHWMAILLGQKDVYRNEFDLNQVLNDLEVFSVAYPNSGYLEKLSEVKQSLREALAKHELGIVLHYAQKDNMKAAQARLERYFEAYSDIDSPLLAKIRSYPELG